jgi:hypothetical protein
MVQNSSEAFAANLAFANVLVTVKTRTERAFRIIHVDNENPFEPDCVANFRQRGFQSFGAPQIVASGEQMRRIYADAERQLWA